MNESSDWLKIIQDHSNSGDAEFDLGLLNQRDAGPEINVGDELLVITGHTTYTFSMISNREADLVTNRSNRPAGRVVIQGCAFGNSETIKPDHLFCGGSLEFTFKQDGILMTHRTTPIVEIRHKQIRKLG